MRRSDFIIRLVVGQLIEKPRRAVGDRLSQIALHDLQDFLLIRIATYDSKVKPRLRFQYRLILP